MDRFSWRERERKKKIKGASVTGRRSGWKEGEMWPEKGLKTLEI